MRLRLIALFLAVLMLGTAVTVSAITLGRNQEEVLYEEQCFFGNREEAEGLTVSVRYNQDNYLIWNTTHNVAESLEPQTEFRYHTLSNMSSSQPYNRFHFYMYVAGNPMDVNWPGSTEELTDNVLGLKPEGLLLAWQELYEKTPEGELTDTNVRYADYCTYYPLDGQLQLPGNYWPFWSIYDYPDTEAELDEYRIAEAFNEYFRIPVLEDDWVQIIIDKRISSMTMESVDASTPREEGSDWFEMHTVSTYEEGKLYFTFDAHSQMGKLVDTSLIPGGYGLYTMEWDENGGKPDTLTTALSLDPDFSPVEMTLDPDTGLLLYQSIRENIWYLTVIDPEKREILQQIPLMEYSEETYSWVSIREDFIIATKSGVEFSVFARNESGCFDYQYTAPIAECWDNHDPYYSGYAFDGERLAVVSTYFTERTEEGFIRQGVNKGYNLAVYGPEGLRYYGEFLSSLQTDKHIVYRSRIPQPELNAVIWENS